MSVRAPRGGRCTRRGAHTLGAVAADPHGQPDACAPLRALLPAAALALVLAAVRLVYLLWGSPYELTEDEAFYWLWAQHLDWSYATKGPGIALAIAASTAALGDTEAGVRLVAVVSGAIAAVGVAGLAADMAAPLGPRRSARGALLAVGLFNLTPAFQATSLLATIDPPYLAAWSLGMWAGYRGVCARSGAGLLALGVMVGVGSLFKHTALLLPAGVGTAAVLARGSARVPLRAWAWLAGAAALAAAGLAPVVVWNAQHDWATAWHLLGHLGIGAEGGAGAAAQGAPVGGAGGAGGVGGTGLIGAKYAVEFVGVQAGVLATVLAAIVFGLVRSGGVGLAPAARRVAVGIGLPLAAFYAAVSLRTRVEGNWPIAAYLSLISLAGATLGAVTEPVWRRGRGPGDRLAHFAWHSAVIAGAVVGLGMLRLDLVRRGLERLGPGAAGAVPIGRLVGGMAMAAHAERLMAGLRDQGLPEPFVLSQHYGRGAQVEFYLARAGGHAAGRPRVRVSSSRTGGRVVQQELWPEYSLDEPGLIGRAAVILSDHDTPELWRPYFSQIIPVGVLDGGVRGTRFGFVGLGFAGMPRPARAGY